MIDEKEVEWIKQNLERFSNCLIPRITAVKKREELLQILAEKGIQCELTVKMDDGSDPVGFPNTTKATYILNVIRKEKA